VKSLPYFVPTFNRSIQIEARLERLTTDSGAMLLRELLERLAIVG